MLVEPNKTLSEFLSGPFKHLLSFPIADVSSNLFKSVQTALLSNSPALWTHPPTPAMALSAPNSTVLPPPYPAIRPEQLRYRCHQILLLPAQQCRLSHPRHQRSRPNPHAIRNQSNGQKNHHLPDFHDRKSLLYTDNDIKYTLNDRDMEATAVLG